LRLGIFAIEMAFVRLGALIPHPSRIVRIIGFIDIILAQIAILTKYIYFDKL